MSSQNHAIAWLVYLARNIQDGNMSFYEGNPKIYLMSPLASCHFTVGRDVNHEPFLGVPLDYTPFFLQMDWIEASIHRESGYLFLEARNPKAQVLNFAFGLKMRKARLDMICVEGKEDINELSLNMKVFEQSKDNPEDVIFPDENDLIGLPLKELDSISDLSNEFDSKYSRSILERARVDASFTSKKLNLK